MACMVPDADKSSADSGKGQSDEDVFNHEGKCCFKIKNTDLFDSIAWSFRV